MTTTTLGAAARLADQLDRAQRMAHLGAVQSLVPDAIERARGIGRGADEPPLAGVTVGVKDNIDVTGTRTTMGSTFFADHLSDTDAPAVRALRAAGAVPSLKTALAEFAMGATGQNQHYGTCRNAHDPERISGGSSSGSAVAVAAGLCDVALGTDTGGSVLVPAALNGIAGLRPGIGRVSLSGVFPVSHLLDRVGPMALDVATLRRVFDVLAGTADDNEFQSSNARPAVPGRDGRRIRVGVPTNHFTADDERVGATLSRARDRLADRGFDLVDVRLDGAEDAQATIVKIMFPDFAAVHETRHREDPDGYGDDVRARLEMGLATSGVEYSRALSWAAAWRRRLERVFTGVDVVLTPSTPVPAPPIAIATTLVTSPVVTRFTHPWCLALGPTLTVPCADDGGLPVGVSLSGPPGSEALLFDVAEQATPRIEEDDHAR